MKKNNLSIFGHIINLLNIPTTAMAQALHVDASLVSKWKTGSRMLTANSPYFENIIDYILEIGSSDAYKSLKSLLYDMFPDEQISDVPQIKQVLSSLLSGTSKHSISTEQHKIIGNLKTIQTLTFNGNTGRRAAVQRLLEYAETISKAGEIIIIESEEFRWLLEDYEYMQYFRDTLSKLLNKGFRATIVLHYSPSDENFKKFFELCSLILFHRNVTWYYSVYYDDSIINFSGIMINHAAILIGLSSNHTLSSTLVFTDKSMIIYYENLLHNIISHCSQIFYNFDIFDMLKMTENLTQFKKNGSFFSFLPVPAFIMVDPNLLKIILDENNVDQSTAEIVMRLNKDFRRVTRSYETARMDASEKFIQIFQLEKLVKRVRKGSFVSRSLSYVCKKDIVIYPKHHAQELRRLANVLIERKNVDIIIASEKDAVFLPMINCWCRENSYMIQMDSLGFRCCDESIVVNAASVALEHCIHRVPPERKNKKAVTEFLLELAQELDDCHM